MQFFREKICFFSDAIDIFRLRMYIMKAVAVYARVAQWIEQKFPKLLVGGSIPLPGTIFTLKKAF